MLARIFRPAKTAMQSGRAGTDHWVLEYQPETRPAADPLMGYTSSSDMLRQVHLEFETLDAARAYAERNAIPYRVVHEHEREVRPMSYADNFRYGRKQAWTH